VLSRPAPAPRRRLPVALLALLLAVLAFGFSIPALLGPWTSRAAPPPAAPAIAILRPTITTTVPAGYLPTPAGPPATTPDGRLTTTPDGRLTTDPTPARSSVGGGR
jgi:hypothetical protein